MLVTALKDSRWFIPLERQAYKTCLTSARLFVRHKKTARLPINNRIPLQSLTAANIMVEGSIIGYESNVNLAGWGKIFWHRCDTQYQLDQIAVNLRVVNVSTGEILSSVNTSKTILSYEVQPGFSALLTTSACLKGKWVTPRTNLLCCA